MPSSWRARRTIAVSTESTPRSAGQVAGGVEQRRQLRLPPAAGRERLADLQGEQLDPLQLGELAPSAAGRPRPDQRPLVGDRGGVLEQQVEELGGAARRPDAAPLHGPAASWRAAAGLAGPASMCAPPTVHDQRRAGDRARPTASTARPPRRPPPPARSAA